MCAHPTSTVFTEMYNNPSMQPGAPRPPTNPQPNPFGNAFYGAGSGLIRSGLGAYGEKIFGSSSEYVSNVSGTFLYHDWLIFCLASMYATCQKKHECILIKVLSFNHFI